MKCKRPRVGNDLQLDLGAESVHKPALENHRFFSIDSVCCTSALFLVEDGAALQHFTSTSHFNLGIRKLKTT